MKKCLKIGNVHVVKFGQGKNMILGLHGWAGAYTDLNVFGQWIDPEKYTLYAVELPGRGESAPSDIHTIDDLVSFLENISQKLGLKKFSLITDFGFSQVSIKFANKYKDRVKGILFIYSPLISPTLIHKKNLAVVYPFIFLLSKTRKLDWAINRLRNSEKVMHKMFLRNENKEAIELELIDINNKRRADLETIFKNGWSMLNTKVIKEWKNLDCKIEVVLAERDEILNSKKTINYLQLNPKANYVMVKDHNHNWDNEFITVMRESLMKVV